MQESGGNVFGVLEDLGITEVRMRDALLRASGAGDLFRQSIELGSVAWAENTALTNEANLRYGTTAAQLSILWNRIVDVAITLGDVMVPALMSVMDKMEPLFTMIENGAQKFAQLDSGTQTLILGAIGLVAVLGPLLITLGFLSIAIAAISWPIVLIVGGIAALVAAFIWAWNNVVEFRIIVMNSFNAIKNVVVTVLGIVTEFVREKLAVITTFWTENGTQIMTAVTNLFNGIMAVVDFVMPAIKWLIETTWNAIKGVIDGALNIIMGLIKVFAGAFTGDFSKLWEGVKQIFFGAVEFIWNLLQLMMFGRIIKGVGTFIKTFSTKIKDGLVKVKEFFTTHLNGILDFITGLGKTFYNAGAGLMNMMKDGIMNAASAVMRAVRNIAQKVRDMLPFSPAKDGPLSDLDKLDFAGPITDSIGKGLPDVQAQMSHMLQMPEMSASTPAIESASNSGNNARPIVINVSAADFTDPEHVRKMARIFGAELGFQIGGAR
jgi:phage-related protein